MATLADPPHRPRAVPEGGASRALLRVVAPLLIAIGLAEFAKATGKTAALAAGSTPLDAFLHLVTGAAALYGGFANLPGPLAVAWARGFGLLYLLVGATGLVAAPFVGPPAMDLVAATHLALGAAAFCAAAMSRAGPLQRTHPVPVPRSEP
ncbi:MAG TPA: hypothetical protein VNZ52_15140 [Candidatus Thermoplasmatota archaeon]|nr:hypothetical protein [Candidatus Thermoplasmatota archaeon]